jgi:hypothetical protein
MEIRHNSKAFSNAEGMGILASRGQSSWSLMSFVAQEVLPFETFDEITEIRICRRQAIKQEARRRKKRRQLTRDGKLVLVAMDHPGRGCTQILSDPLAMGNRYELLARTLRLLEDPGLDGVVATGDQLEELLILSYLQRRSTRRSILDERVLVGSMNRGGLAGTAFEMDDAFTSVGVRRLRELRADGGKMMYRLDPQEPASGRTIRACAEVITELGRNHLPAFLEALTVLRRGDHYESENDSAALIRQCGIAAALGETSSHVWLKLPYCEGFDRVCCATTLPILLLGGPARESPADLLHDFAAGLAAGTRVRGAIIGRNLLFPAAGDPLPICRALTAIVHRNAGIEETRHFWEHTCEVHPHAQ